MRGHVRKRNNSCSVVVDHDRDEDGKRRQKWHSGYRTKRDADRALTEILNRIGSGTCVDPGRQTMTEYLREWLVAIQQAVRPWTWTSYRSNIDRQVVARLGGRALRQLGASHLDVLCSELLDDGRCDGAGWPSPCSVRYIRTILHRVLRDAVRWGKPPRNPAAMTDPPRSRAPEMKAWQKGGLRRFLASVEGDRLYVAWLLVSTMSLRRVELLGLGGSDLDFEAGRAAIRQTLSSVGDEVTSSTPKTTKSPRSIASRFHDLSLRANLPPIRLHDVRYTYTSIGLGTETHPKVMAERLGHATVGIALDTYSHVAPAIAEQAADDLAGLILAQPRTDCGASPVTTGPDRTEPVVTAMVGREGFEPPWAVPADLQSAPAAREPAGCRLATCRDRSTPPGPTPPGPTPPGPRPPVMSPPRRCHRIRRLRPRRMIAAASQPAGSSPRSQSASRSRLLKAWKAIRVRVSVIPPSEWILPVTTSASSSW